MYGVEARQSSHRNYMAGRQIGRHVVLYMAYVYIRRLYAVRVVLHSLSFICVVFLSGSFCPSLWLQTLLVF